MEQSKKILVVDNDEVVALLISHILARQSYAVHTALDGLGALDVLHSDAYDAILLDLKVPNGGVDLLRRIEKLDPGLLRKVIVVTGNVPDSHALEGLPIHAVVRKPFEVAALIETVRACVTPKA